VAPTRPGSRVRPYGLRGGTHHSLSLRARTRDSDGHHGGHGHGRRARRPHQVGDGARDGPYYRHHRLRQDGDDHQGKAGDDRHRARRRLRGRGNPGPGGLG
jgi:hypothetical protein